MSNSDFGLIGLAVMGQNLVLNVESRGFQVSVYNRTTAVTDEFVAAHPGQKTRRRASRSRNSSQSLARPRKVMIMVKAGGPVDAVIEQLIPLLDKGDIIIDGGNSLYTDTERRDAVARRLGFRFIGAGVSGGEEGARKGPSIMPGGPASTWEVMKPIFESIAAKVDGEPCVVHIGPGGAGHYVKMIHNGIEYGDMQLICEAYNIFKAAGFTADELADSLHRLERRRPRKLPHPDHRRDLQAEGPGNRQAARRTSSSTPPARKAPASGRCINAVENAVVISTINAAVEARILSSMKDERVAASKQLAGPKPEIDADKAEARQEGPRRALRLQDHLLRPGPRPHHHHERRRRTGTSTSARSPPSGAAAASSAPASSTTSPTPTARDPEPDQPDARPRSSRTCSTSSSRTGAKSSPSPPSHGIPVPAFSASLGYYDSYRSARPPRQPAPGPARLLRRPHLRAHRQTARRDVPHRLARGHRLRAAADKPQYGSIKKSQPAEPSR